MIKKEMLETLKHGQEILSALFSMPAAELKRKVHSILPGIDILPFDFQNSLVRKTSHDDVPQKIEFIFYDSVVIDLSGISFVFESGRKKVLKEFDLNFRL